MLSLTDMADTIYTQIINGQIPAHFVYESPGVVGFLDIHPTQPGHTLIVPKIAFAQFTDMKSGDFEDLMMVSHEFAKHMQKILQCKRVVLRIEGFDIDHVHVHLIPCNQEHDSYKEGRGQIEPDHEALRAMALKLKYER
jgi:histidine triad (HIT) family protein